MVCMKYLVIAAFVAIIGSLATALVYMMRGGSESEKDGTPRKNHMARALAFRVGFSILLFVVVLISYLMGWIPPTGLPLRG
jgi:O-antigen/teichoic acid export membrane protein